MCTLVLWLGQIWHFLPVCHILSAVWRSGVLQHSAHSGRQIHSTKSWTHTIQTAAHYWFCVFVSECMCVYLCIINPLHGLIQLCAVVGDGCSVLLKNSQQRPCLQTKTIKNKQTSCSWFNYMIRLWNHTQLTCPQKISYASAKNFTRIHFYISANQTPTAALKVCLNILLVPVFFKALLTVRNKSHSQAVFLKAEWLQPVVWLSWMYFTLL